MGFLETLAGLSIFGFVLHRQRSARLRSARTFPISSEVEPLIRRRFEHWKATRETPLRDISELHPDLFNIIHVTDPSIVQNEPPHSIDELSLVAQQVLSGITPTVSTIPGAFLPSREALVTSFNMLREFSLLTEGGRAFTKHCHRCESGWWGSAKGPASKINEIAQHKVEEILDKATWKNVFYLPGDRPVCEFRVKAGYGARWTWSQNANEIVFRGFLEPPQENGHEVGWRH